MPTKIPADVLAALRESGIGIAPSAETDPIPSAPSDSAQASATLTSPPKSKPSPTLGWTSPASSTAAPAPAGKSLRIPDWLVHGLPKVDGAMWDRYRRVALGRGESPEALVAEAVMFYGDNFLG